uniref:HELICc2 domain-containing protein n=1 Tax=Caenorhabditis tropicalis TaxID=1561998 RepID=A0A1I7TFR6_9PELO
MFEKRDTDPAFLMRRLDSIISNPGKNGTLIFAVIRGKFSEGVAFANDRARVVISIGVPYADIHDDQIKAKKSYNNKINRKGDWYSTHAFRPMNLALGRAFGNKDDWAAILMIDRRLGGKQPRVSKWIRDRLVTYPYYDEFKRDFLEFMNRKLGIVKIEL